MIGLLRGEIVVLTDSEVLIDVAGVGYRVQAGTRMLARLTPGEQAVLYIETRMSENAIALFGFISEAERLWFVRLQSVPGVGARVALAVLDVLAPAELSDAIALGDATRIQQSKGVGRKLAERIVAEFADAPGLAGAEFSIAGAGRSGAREASVSALVNLGYGRSEAVRAVARVAEDGGGEDKDEAQWIRAALKALAV